jgi:serine/threonine-protein kinase
MSLRARLYALSLADRQRYDTLIDRFEAGWCDHPDEPPEVAAHLPPDEPLRTLVLVALVKSDLESRLRRHEPATLEDYLGRFPELSHDTQATAELLAWNHHSSHPGGAESSPPGRASRYLVQEPVGRGGIGIVCRGRDPQLDRELAVKILRPEHAGNPVLVRRFEQEARVLGRLQHPGVVPVYDSGRLADGRPWFIMRLLSGGHTLAHLLGQRQHPQGEQARFLAIFEQVCQTVAYAHGQGVIHRDLKPANIMVGAFGEVQVMDWGFAGMLPAGRCFEETPPEQPATGAVTPPPSESRGGSTLAGAVLGTPAYMAPEQARGEVERLDERCDVFGLGAVLCEVLTGRPPYTGPSVFVVRERAARADLEEAWERLDQCGADADLVALAKRCLADEPAARPGNAGEVARAVGAHLAEVQQRLGEAERERAAAEARAEEAAARTRLERRARRLTAWLAAAALVLAAGGVWVWQQVMGQQRAVEAALTKATELRDRYQYAQALTVLEQAEQGADHWSRQRLAAALAELRLAQRLDGIRGSAVQLTDGKWTWRAADEEYEAAFRQAGLGAPEDPAKEVAARVRGSAIREALAAAVDDWAVRTENEERRAWLLEVARRAELSPEGDARGWEERFRDAQVWRRRTKLEQLAREADLSALSPQTVYALAWALRKQGGDAVPLLRSAQDRHPDDFWLTEQLGEALYQVRRFGEAEGYWRAARALRPDSAVVYNNLGTALAYQGKQEEAIACYRRAIDLDPKLAQAHYSLGTVLQQQGKREEAIACYRRAIERDPQSIHAHTNLGVALAEQGNLEEAVVSYRRAIELDAKPAQTHNNLGAVLQQQGKLDEAVASYRRALERNPNYAEAHCNLGLTLRQQGRFQEALAALQQGHELGTRSPGWRHPSAVWVGNCRRLVELEPRLPGLLAGTDRPANDTERLEFARLCDLKQRYAAAARLYAEAFVAQPSLTADLQVGHRYGAACSAAQAGCGRGVDGSGLSAGERLRWRRQALTWLRDDLAGWARLLQGGGPAVGPALTQPLRHWQSNPDLAGLRDPAELARLPAEERAACQRFWADVAALLRQAQGQ